MSHFDADVDADVDARAVPRQWPATNRLTAQVRAFDEAVDTWAAAHRNPAADRLFYGLSSAADHSILWFALGAVQSARRSDVSRGLRLAVAIASESIITNGIVKSFFRRVRPALDDAAAPLPFNMRRPVTSAFPSGHATSAFMAAVVLSEGTSLGPMYFGLAGLVSASRVYVRMHHASDVVAGAAFGLALGVVARRVLPRP
jgi:undecaprenyl-diphosphatase